MAPTRLWPGWEGATSKAARAVADRYENEGFQIPALQAVLFGVEGIALFGSTTSRVALSTHLLRVADLAAGFRASVVVFGAPGTRRRGSIPYEQAFLDASEFFAEISIAYLERGVQLCIEPNPVRYGCDFVTTAEEGRALTLATPGLGLHLDAAALFLSEEDPVERLSRFVTECRHFHASEPDLEGFLSHRVDHRAFADVLRAHGFEGWVSLEMREQAEVIIGLRAALKTVSDLYGNSQ